MEWRNYDKEKPKNMGIKYLVKINCETFGINYETAFYSKKRGFWRVNTDDYDLDCRDWVSVGDVIQWYEINE